MQNYNTKIDFLFAVLVLFLLQDSSELLSLPPSLKLDF